VNKLTRIVARQVKTKVHQAINRKGSSILKRWSLKRNITIHPATPVRSPVRPAFLVMRCDKTPSNRIAKVGGRINDMRVCRATKIPGNLVETGANTMAQIMRLTVRILPTLR
jgi:hypothetical protein